MTTAQTQVNLALYIGETFAEVEIRDFHSRVIFKKNFYLPQTSLRTLLGQLKKTHLNPESPQPIKIKNVFVVSRYFDKLKPFRLGGSVAQITHAGFENSYAIENTTKNSLAASSLIIPLDGDLNQDFLVRALDKIKKINPEANKVVLNLDQNLASPEQLNQCLAFFDTHEFKVFNNSDFKSTQKIRKTLLNAGTEGTKDELISDIRTSLEPDKVYFWIKDQFTEQFDNADIYFSSIDFLQHRLQQTKKEFIINFGIENWFAIDRNSQNIWDSPWGKVERPHPQQFQIGLHPLTEVFIDEVSMIQFSKSPISIEPGPMIAGRGSKTTVLDLFSDEIALTTVSELFPNSNLENLKKKILSQFKAMEKGQNINLPHTQFEELKKSVLDLISFDFERYGIHADNCILHGQIASVLSPFKALPNTSSSWSESVFSEVTRSTPELLC